MRPIEKGTEPAELADFRAAETADWKPRFSNLTTEAKAATKKQLLEEQGFICCYCNDRVDAAGSHIEHVKPQNPYRDEDLKYENLLASCPGKEADPPSRRLHCGNAKGNWYDAALFVSPLEAGCDAHFTFTTASEIRPRADSARTAAAVETIGRLRLDCAKLTEKRRSAVIGLGIETLTSDDVEEMAIAYEQRDAIGQFAPFCSAIAFILRLYGEPRGTAAPTDPAPSGS